MHEDATIIQSSQHCFLIDSEESGPCQHSTDFSSGCLGGQVSGQDQGSGCPYRHIQVHEGCLQLVICLLPPPQVRNWSQQATTLLRGHISLIYGPTYTYTQFLFKQWPAGDPQRQSTRWQAIHVSEVLIIDFPCCTVPFTSVSEAPISWQDPLRELK